VVSLPSDRVLGLLAEVKSVATTASMTGSLDGGARTLVHFYNRCLAAAGQEDPMLKELFPVLADDAGMDAVGVAAALLLGYLRPARRAKELGTD